MKIKQPIQNALNEMGYDSLRPIQNTVIPMIRHQKNLFVLAKTGSGKTAAYLIPAIESVDPDKNHTFILVIAPTRELAIQISLEAKLIASYTKVHIVTLIGGMDTKKQVNALRHHPHIIIGTPGRLLDLYNRNLLNLSSLSLLVIDEADQIYTTGQAEDVHQLRSNLKNVQTVCLSATKNSQIENYFDNVFETVEQDDVAVNERIQTFFIPADHKTDTLKKLLFSLPITTAIVFVNHRSTALKLSESFAKQNILCSAFSGYFDERKRIEIMNRFKKGDIRILFATDAAARGIDIRDLSYVIHYDIPTDTETYIHRSGRTAHQGDEGISIALLDHEDMLSDVGMYIRLHSTIYADQDHSPQDLSVPYHKVQRSIPNTTQVLIRAGREDKLRPKDIIGALCTVFSFDEIGTLEIQERFSTVTILAKDDNILSRLEGLSIKGKFRKIELLNKII